MIMSIHDHIKRMEKTKTIGDYFEFLEFKKEFEEWEAKMKDQDRVIRCLRESVSYRNRKIEKLKERIKRK